MALIQEIERVDRQIRRAKTVLQQAEAKRALKQQEYNREMFRIQQGRVYKVFVACPAYRWPIDDHTAMSLNATVAHPGLDVEFQAVVGDAHIERARAMLLMHSRLHPKVFDYFLNVDWDIEWNPEDLYRMCCRADTHKIAVLGGPYAFKTEDEKGKAGQAVMRVLPGAQVNEATHMIECAYVGSGFMLIDAGLFHKIQAQYPELQFNANPDLHSEMPPTLAAWNPVIIPRPDWGENHGELLSEDYSFCHRVREMGERVVMDLTVKLTHWSGDKAFRLPMEPAS